MAKRLGSKNRVLIFDFKGQRVRTIMSAEEFGLDWDQAERGLVVEFAYAGNKMTGRIGKIFMDVSYEIEETKIIGSAAVNASEVMVSASSMYPHKILGKLWQKPCEVCGGLVGYWTRKNRLFWNSGCSCKKQKKMILRKRPWEEAADLINGCVDIPEKIKIAKAFGIVLEIGD